MALRMGLRRVPGSRQGPPIARGAAGIFGLSTISAAIGFATAILLAHALGARGYGEYAWVVAVVTIVQLFGVVGMDRLAVREVAVLSARSASELPAFVMTAGLLTVGASSALGLGVILIFAANPSMSSAPMLS